MNDKRISFNSYSLKIIALITMTIDHIGQFISGMPFFFRMIGRISAPLFLFTLAYSFQNTSSRNKFVLRMYLSSVAMELIKFFVSLIDPISKYTVQNNIFNTIFMILLISTGIEGFLIFFRGNDKTRAFIYLTMALVPIIWTAIPKELNGVLGWVFKALAPTLLQVEGDIPWVVLGVAMCLFARRKPVVIWFYIFYCALELVATIIEVGAHTLLINIQWMMVFALPFMLLYDEKKGKSSKWFFYIYYPVHIWLLYLLGQYIFTN